MLESLNALSRYVCQNTPALSEFENMFRKAKQTKPYPKAVRILAYGLSAGSFALFFGGNACDALIAFLAGISVFFVDSLSNRHLTGIAKVFISSFLISLIAGIGCYLGIGSDGGMIIIGAIMLLVPGITIGIAMRDIFCGDTLAGLIKLLQACLSALMIAFGYFLAVYAIGGLGGVYI